LHELGYNYFNINALTIAEVNVLVDSFNQREKDKDRDIKKSRKK